MDVEHFSFYQNERLLKLVADKRKLHAITLNILNGRGIHCPVIRQKHHKLVLCVTWAVFYLENWHHAESYGKSSCREKNTKVRKGYVW